MSEILDSVRAKYGAVAESTLSTNDAGVKEVAEAFGYSAEELTSIPAKAVNAARSQYADPAWDGVDWKDARPPKTHAGLQFAAGLSLGLVFCLGLVLLRLHGAHHR